MKSNERDILHYELEFSSSSKIAKLSYSLNDVLETLNSSVSDNMNRKPIGKGSHVLELVEFDVDSNPDYAAGFVAVTTPNIADAVYRDTKKNESRSMDKGPDDVDEFGAHIFISKHKAADGTFRIYIEKVTSIGASNVERLFRFIIEQYHRAAKADGALGYKEGSHKLGKKKPDGSPVLIGYRLMAHITGIPSDDAQKLVDDGFATGIVLQRKKSKIPFLSASYMVPKEEELKVKLEKKNFVANLWDDVLSHIKKNSGEYDRARITFKTSSGDSGDIWIDADSLNVLSERFTKRTSLFGISPPLKNSAKGIVMHFTALVVKELP